MIDMHQRMNALRAEGQSPSAAFLQARLEARIADWPEGWGDYLEAWLYGAIEIQEDVKIERLGLQISKQKKTADTGFVFGGRYAYRCHVTVKARDLEGVSDAIERLEQFVNAWQAVSFGRTIHYYCSLVADSQADVEAVLGEDLEAITRFLDTTQGYPEKARVLVGQAGWWLRQAHHSFFSGVPIPSRFTAYSAYWKAFESLIEAILVLRPLATEDDPPGMQARIAEFFARFQKAERPPTPRELGDFYATTTRPGFQAKARHVLGLMFDAVAPQYINKVLRRGGLASIRNKIEHGSLVEYRIADRLLVEAGFDQLQLLVRILVRLAGGQPVPVNHDIKSCFTCAHLRRDNADHPCGLDRLPAGRLTWRYVCGEHQVASG